MMNAPMGGGMPPGPGGPAPYPGAYQALQQSMQDYVGFPEIDDILGVGQEVDSAACEAEYGGEAMPLSSYSMGDEGVYGGSEVGAPLGQMGGMSNAPSAADPYEDDSTREGIRDLLAERSKKRLAASENFQSKASEMMSPEQY